MKRFTIGAAFLGAMTGSLLGHLLLLSPQRAEASPRRDDVVKAQRYELVDLKGRVVGTWSAEQGSPVLKMRNAKMNGGLRAYLTEDGGVNINLERSNEPTQEIFDKPTQRIHEVFKAGSPSFMLTVDKAGDAKIETWDRSGKATWRAP